VQATFEALRRVLIACGELAWWEALWARILQASDLIRGIRERLVAKICVFMPRRARDRRHGPVLCPFGAVGKHLDPRAVDPEFDSRRGEKFALCPFGAVGKHRGPKASGPEFDSRRGEKVVLCPFGAVGKHRGSTPLDPEFDSRRGHVQIY
jgi:hypothetical protein